MILPISKHVGSRGGATEILTIEGVQKCQFFKLEKLENWTNWYAWHSCKLIINNECLVSIKSLDVPQYIIITKTVQFWIS